MAVHVRGASLGLLAFLFVQLQGCGSESTEGMGSPRPGPGPGLESNPTTEPPAPPQPSPVDLRKVRPWEVISDKGETYLSDVFYADAAQNEQVMPYAIDGHTMIDRVIYPTLGNPNLYTKADKQDSFMVVTRLEDEAIAHLSPKVRGQKPGTDLGIVELSETNASHVTFLLVPRAARPTTTEIKTPALYGSGTGVLRIKPSEVLVHDEPPDMPVVLKRRKTYRFVFRQDVMAGVPAGLYDLRVEIRRENQLVALRGLPVYEYQYNALRVFDTESDEYTAVNVTDTQVSTGSVYDSMTLAKLDDFVYFVNTSLDPGIRKAAFITFNGDLHNGGSPAGLRQRFVATTYAAEAKVIVQALRKLTIPIFLTTGNHDGYVAAGNVPSAVKSLDTAVGTTLQEVVGEATPKAWPDFKWAEYQAYLDRTQNALGGLHRNIFTGGFIRRPGDTFAKGWQELPRAERNMFLYDGFYQWQKTYGPLYSSWKFGKNRFVNLNSYEMRQHRRSGWGMYTVNYGGAMSDLQVDWLDRELTRAKDASEDVLLLAHHDPRGGHGGQDFGYLFEQIEYQSVQQSAFNYIVGEILNPQICKLPWWAITAINRGEACLHDGLQEWMRPDPEFDCKDDERLPDGRCDGALFTGPGAKPLAFSNLQVLDRIAKDTQVRTLVFGHTHYNSYEMWQAGDQLIPGKLPIDDLSVQKFASIEIENPLRGFATLETESMKKSVRVGGQEIPVSRRVDYDPAELSEPLIKASVRAYAEQYERVTGAIKRTLESAGKPRELAILRLTTNSDGTSQKYQGRAMYGFSVLYINKKTDARAYAHPQINRVTYFINAGKDRFDLVRTVDLDRTVKVSTRDPKNPVGQLFQ